MADVVLKAENVSKQYTIGHLVKDSRYVTLRDVLMQKVGSIWHKTIDVVRGKPILHGDTREEIWALKDVSFEIRRGEAVGIIGRNGAGKSTLLKILSRITEPSAGRVIIKGRVASLLEVGTGFHSELTGRENIYLNGAILGMSRQEIRSKFDEIVAFAETERFLDTPVKHYSSGMYVRLAFAVAAHLEPEILIVDEVLAVGDAQFQKRCLGKMEEACTREGRTVLFVSHQMGAIAQFCKKAFLLREGEIVRSGSVQQVVHYYMNLSSNGATGYEANTMSQLKEVAILRAQLLDAGGLPSGNFAHNEEIAIVISCQMKRRVIGAEVRILVRDSKRRIFTSDTELATQDGRMSDILCARAVIPAGLLRPGHYHITLATYLPNQVIFDEIEDALSLDVVDGGSKYAASEGLDYGCIFVDCKWTVACDSSFS